MANRHATLASLFSDIAEAIRNKTGGTAQFAADDFDTQINSIVTDPSGDATADPEDILASKTAYSKGSKITGTIPTINDSGDTTLNSTTSSVSFDAGYYPSAHGATHAVVEPTADIITATSNADGTGEGIDSITVSVAIPEGYSKNTTLTKTFDNLLPELETDATADQILNGYEAYTDEGKKVTGSMPNNAKATITLDASENNQSYTVARGYHGGEDTVSIVLQSKSATPSESEQTISPDAGKVLSGVTVGAISSTFVGSGVARKSSTDLSASGNTVSVPAGYYAEAASKAVAAGSATGPLSLSASSATLTTGTNTLTLTKTSVATTPTVSAGYVSAATASTATVALTASVTTKAAATFNTSTSDQTISASQYLTGAQTIKAVTTSNIAAGNIKAGVTIQVGDANSAGRIANVAGTFTSDGTATAANILSGKIAYVNGSKITGTATAGSASVSGTTLTITPGFITVS